MATKVITVLRGEFVTPEVVKSSVHKEYNKLEWNKTIDRYSFYDECRFFRDSKSDNLETNYYVIYVADGIRFLQKVSYGSCLSDGGFVFGFFQEGIKDPQRLKQLGHIAQDFSLDTLTVLQFTEGRIGTHEKSRSFMRQESKLNEFRFYTKAF